MAISVKLEFNIDDYGIRAETQTSVCVFSPVLLVLASRVLLFCASAIQPHHHGLDPNGLRTPVREN